VISVRQRVRNTVRLEWPDGASEQARLVSIGKSGGAGEVLAIEGKPGYLAKIYHAAIAAPQLARYERKLEWMLRNKPDLPPIPPDYEGIVQLAWPVALARKESGFAGFVMEKVDFDRTMELDYLLTRRQAAREGFEADFGKIVTVCANLAALIQCLHSRRIAVVDLKPINLKVYKSELYVSILDCDGFHIHSDDFVSEAPQVTPEYLAPEFHDRAVTQPEAQDRFALATIIFRLLNYGIHPFSGVAAGRAGFPSELSGRIRLGLYPYGRFPRSDVRAAPASVHQCLPDSIRELFDRSFTAGAGGRAGAHEWATVLSGFANRNAGTMSRCRNGHLQFAGQPCPTCVREGILRGHLERQKRFVTKLRTSPVRAASYVRRTLKGTRPSPFQAALAQVQLNPLRLAPVTMSIRNVVAIEILWALGLIVTYWWLK
jgi:DNA-binding helix-hairpin-helix protein with protein kinase domain